MQKSTAPKRRNWLISTARSVLPGQDDGADQRGEQEHRHDLEGHEVGREDGVANGAGPAGGGDGLLAAALELGELLVLEEVDEHVAEDAEQEESGDDGDAALVVVELTLVAELGPGEHDAEQEEHDDGAD